MTAKLSFMRSKVVFFDLDDTLYHEVDFLKSAYREIASFIETNYHLQGIYAEMMGYWQAGEKVFQCLLASHSLHDLTIQDLLLHYRAHVPQITLSIETQHTLEHLHAKGIRMGLITDGRTLTQQNKIAALGIKKYFEEQDIYISEAFGSEKTEGKSFQDVQQRYGENSEIFYVGDNPKKDFAWPNALGWITICLLDDGQNIHSQQFNGDESCLPQYKIHHIEDLCKLIDKNSFD